MKHLSLVLITGLLLTIGITAQAGKVYKWQGDDGSWHYSEKPPAEKESEILKIKASKPTEQSTTEKYEQKESGNSADQPEEAPLKLSPEIAAEERELNAKNCSLARQNLESLSTQPRIRYMDKEKGEERYLTPEEHDDWSKKSKDQIEEFCQ